MNLRDNLSSAHKQAGIVCENFFHEALCGICLDIHRYQFIFFFISGNGHVPAYVLILISCKGCIFVNFSGYVSCLYVLFIKMMLGIFLKIYYCRYFILVIRKQAT